MNSKKSVFLASAAICLMAAPITMASGRGGGHPSGSFSASHGGFAASRSGFAGSRSGYMGTRAGYAGMRTGTQFARSSRGVAGNWHGGGNHHGHHHRGFNNVFIGGFGFPYYGYGWGYPYYGYGWDYPYYGYGYDPYDNGYYSYDQGYYSNNGGVYEGRPDSSLVLRVQRRLARAGYYHGTIDGVIGGGTRSAIRAYERSHRLPVDGVIDSNLLATMGVS